MNDLSLTYSKVFIDAFGYELAPNVVTSEDLEFKLGPLYEALHIQAGQLEAITGIYEQRFWDHGFKMYQGAAMAGRKVLEISSIDPFQIGMLIYAGVCRDNLEPATACAVASELELAPHTQVYDVSNACLGVLNAMIQVANAIELGQIRAGLIVSCESSRQIVELTIERLLKEPNMDHFKKSLATLTGGSGAVGLLMTTQKLSRQGHRLVGGVVRNAAKHHGLCRWGPDTGIPASFPVVMETDSVGVLRHGVALGAETFRDFKHALRLSDNKPDKVICHQVGSAHQKTILDSLGISPEKDFTTYRFLGNIGTVSLPITAAIASEREFLEKGNFVGFFGIGSGLNCLMLGVDW
jgi:acyl-CoA:acyl-CoA alkyltransferase